MGCLKRMMPSTTITIPKHRKLVDNTPSIFFIIRRLVSKYDSYPMAEVNVLCYLIQKAFERVMENNGFISSFKQEYIDMVLYPTIERLILITHSDRDQTGVMLVDVAKKLKVNLKTLARFEIAVLKCLDWRIYPINFFFEH